MVKKAPTSIKSGSPTHIHTQAHWLFFGYFGTYNIVGSKKCSHSLVPTNNRQLPRNLVPAWAYTHPWEKINWARRKIVLYWLKPPVDSNGWQKNKFRFKW